MVKKLSRKSFAYYILFALALVACTNKNNVQDKNRTTLQIVIPDNSPQLDALLKGQRLGLFLVRQGTLLGSSTLLGGIKNVPYIYTSASLKSEQGDGIVVENNFTGFSLVGYAPYRPELVGYEFPVDLSAQADSTRVNILRFTGSYEGDLGNGVSLAVERVMSKAYFALESADAVTDDYLREQSPLISISGALIGGTYDIATGTFTPKDGRGMLTAIPIERSIFGEEHSMSYLSQLYLLPGDNASNYTVRLTLGLETHVFNPISLPLRKGGEYLITMKVKWNKELGTWQFVHLTQQGLNLNGSESLVVETIPYEGKEGGDTPAVPEIAPVHTPYMEIPSEIWTHQGALLVRHTAPDGWFRGGVSPKGVRRNYTLLFAQEHRIPLWVAYPMYSSCKGTANRTDEWDYDPEVEKKLQAYLFKSYGVSGWSRGHMLPSDSRDASTELNETTFYFTNMIPQNSNQNSSVWQQLEAREQTWGNGDARYDTLYIATGPILPEGERYLRDRAGNLSTIPTHTWKCILAKDKRDGGWYSMAVKIPNETIPSGSSWKDYMVTVSSLEEEVGFSFFPNLPQDIAHKVKSQLDKQRWQ